MSLFSSDSLKLDSSLQRTHPLLKNLLIVHFRFGSAFLFSSDSLKLDSILQRTRQLLKSIDSQFACRFTLVQVFSSTVSSISASGLNSLRDRSPASYPEHLVFCVLFFFFFLVVGFVLFFVLFCFVFFLLFFVCLFLFVCFFFVLDETGPRTPYVDL